MGLSRQEYCSGLPFSKLLIRERKCLKTERCTRPLTHNTHNEIASTLGESSGHKTIDLNLEERQIS